MKTYCVYQQIENQLVKVGRPYVDLDKAIKFAERVAAHQVEVRHGNWLYAVKINGEIKVVPAL